MKYLMIFAVILFAALAATPNVLAYRAPVEQLAGMPGDDDGDDEDVRIALEPGDDDGDDEDVRIALDPGDDDGDDEDFRIA